MAAATTRQPAEHRFAAPAGEICWFEWGERGAGPSLLLLHATGFHARLWDGVVRALPDNLHIIAPDFRGHGRSFRPPSLGDWAATSADIVALLDVLKLPAMLGVGHSMGAHCLARIAAARPATFTRLLLVDPVIMAPSIYVEVDGAHGADPQDHPVSRRRNQWDSAAQMTAHFATRPPYAAWDAAVLADYCQWGLVPAGDGQGLELACPPRLEASTYMGAVYNNPYPVMRGIACPVTVLRAKTGERQGPLDFSLSPTDPALAQFFGQGWDMQWTDQSHFIPMEAPTRLAALIMAELAAA